MKDATQMADPALELSSVAASVFFERSRAIQLLVDPSTGRIVDANPAACAFYGYSRPDLRARYVTDLNTLSAEQVAEAMAAAVAERRSHFLFPARLASGELREVEVQSGPIELGGRSLLLSVIHDVTGQHRADDTLRMHAQAVAASMDGMAMLDAQERFVYANPASAQLHGYRAEELRGRRFGALYAPTERERLAQDVLP